MGAGDIRAARNLLAAALQDDPGWVHVLPDRSRRLALRTVVGVALRDAQRDGSVLAAREGHALAGVALWFAPGRYPMSRLRKLRTTPALMGLASRIGIKRMGKLAEFGGSIDRAFPTEPVWYLSVLGVQPGMQRRGVGQALLMPALRTADNDGVGCYLETSKPDNVAYYERFGFAVLPTPGPLYDDGPTMWRMLRPPKT